MNASSMAVLGLGLLNSLVIPKLTIEAIGITEYGRYALLVGFALLPNMVDLGLLPGLTREIGRLHGEGNEEISRGLARYFQRLFGVLGASVVCAAAAAVGASGMASASTVGCVIAGGAANLLVMLTDVGLIRTRVAGAVAAANGLRAAYYITFLCLVVVSYLTWHLSAEVLFIAQAASATAYAIVGQVYGRLARPTSYAGFRASEIAWRRLGKAALPEQLSRAQSSLLPSAERSLLLSTGGPSELSAYDIALRLSTAVTALPGIVAEPVLALLSSRMGGQSVLQRRLILRHARIATYIAVAVSGTCVLLFGPSWAEAYFHLDATSFRTFVWFVVGGSSVNVLTAAPVGALYAAGKVRAIVAKGLGDVLLALIAIGVAATLKNPLVYVAIRYMGFLLTAGGLLFYWRRVHAELVTSR
jgi:O-antigen/teichoic acid export membrane protein